MGPPQLIRRHLLLGPLVAALPTAAVAQDDATDQAAIAWGRAAVLTWSQILGIPINIMTEGGGTLPAYSVAGSETELAEARGRARATREWGEREIARCRAMVAALGPTPQISDGWEQRIVDQIKPEQIAALDRLALMFAFIETTGMRYVAGELPFTPVMRMCNYAMFAEVSWIMAASMKLARLAFEPDSFADLWMRLAGLDSLVSSVMNTTYMRVLNGDERSHIVAAQAVLTTAAAEARQITTQFATSNLSRLNLIGEQRQRLAPLLPQLAAIGAAHATRLEETAVQWGALTSEQILAETEERVPQYMREAGPLIERAGVQL